MTPPALGRLRVSGDARTLRIPVTDAGSGVDPRYLECALVQQGSSEDRACRPDWDARKGVASISVGRLPAGPLCARACGSGDYAESRDALAIALSPQHVRTRVIGLLVDARGAIRVAPAPGAAVLRRAAPGRRRLSRRSRSTLRPWPMRSRSRVASRAPTCCPSTTSAARSRTAMEREPTVALSYSPGGHPGLRRWIGERHGAPGERVVCANGSLEVFAFVTSVLLARASTRRVLVEAPTYDRSILILQRAGADVVGVPVDGDGIDTDALAAELEREAPAFLYVIPNFQNPSGATMSLERRRRVLELAAQHDVVVVEDDPYGLLRWAGESHPTLYELDGGAARADALVVHEDGRAGPAHRLRRRARRDSPRRSASTPRTPTSRPAWSRRPGSPRTARPATSSPASSARSWSSRRAATRWSSPCARTSRPSAQMVVPEGGYFLWIDLGPGADTTALAARAAEAGVPFVKGADFFADGGGTTCLRLAFSAVPPDRIREGIERLGAVIAAG